MKKPLKVIAWFEEIGKADIPIAGGKGANLGELTRARVPVPPGFIVTTDAYSHFIKEARLTQKISSYLKALDPKDSDMLQETAFRIKQMISLQLYRQLYPKPDAGAYCARAGRASQ